MQVIDNILTHEEHKELKEFFHSSHCPWHFNERANQFFDDNFYFTQLLFDNQTFTTPWSEKYIKQLLKKITQQLDSNVELLRAKANLFTNRNKTYHCGYHTDFLDVDDYYTLVYYINTNNGGTQIKNGNFYKSVENTGLLFYGNVEHESVTQTDTDIRTNINLNFRKLS